MTNNKWRATLSPEQFRVLRLKGTEPPNTGSYTKSKEQGVYHCAGCDAPLYKSTTKFDSGCGWPAFFGTIHRSRRCKCHEIEGLPGAIDTKEDRTHGMLRVEILCASCGGHLGHVFKGSYRLQIKNEKLIM